MDSTETERSELRERIKELNCLYRIAELCAHRKNAMEVTLRKMLPYIAAGWQFPSKAAVRIRIDELDIQSRNYRRSGGAAAKIVRVNGEERGRLEIRYPELHDSGSAEPLFLDGEEKLLDTLAVLIGNMVAGYEAEDELRTKARALQRRQRELERKNIALREILGQLEIEKKELGDRILANIENFIMPSLIKLENGRITADLHLKYVRSAGTALREITSPFGLQISSRLYGLSPREIEISSLVRSSWSSKDIADLLCISITTVERHRHNIRRKLGIANTTINLTSRLLDMRDAP